MNPLLQTIIAEVGRFLVRFLGQHFGEVQTERDVDSSEPLADVSPNWHEKYTDFAPPLADPQSKHKGGRIDPQMTTIHYTASNASIGAMEKYMLGRKDPASYNFLVDNMTGEVRNLVHPGLKSFSDGKSQFMDAKGNWRNYSHGWSVSLSVCQDGKQKYGDECYKSIAQIIHYCLREYRNYRAWRVVGHEHVAPARRNDPGINFDWHKLMVDYVGFSEKFWEDYLSDLYFDTADTVGNKQQADLKRERVKRAISRLQQDWGGKTNRAAFSYGRNSPGEIREYYNSEQ